MDGATFFRMGAALYEMLTGQLAFEGKLVSVASAILEREPTPINSIKPLTPPALDHAIRRCLAKDPEQRWQTGRDLHGELIWIRESASSVATPLVLSGKQGRRGRLAWIVAGLFAVIAVAEFWLSWPKPQIEERAFQFKIDPPPGTEFLLENGGGNVDAVSPSRPEGATMLRSHPTRCRRSQRSVARA
jgi:eukaryotic-like serine/threonine-protein kinase